MRILVWVALLIGLSLQVVGAQTISGRITNRSTGAGLVGFDIDVFENGKSVDLTGGRSGVNGNFSINLPGAGTYVLRVDANSSTNATPEPFADQWYRQGSAGTLFPSQATLIPVGAGQTVSNINVSLPPSAVTLNGVVRFNGATAAAVNLDLFVLNPSTQAREFLGSVPGTSAANGAYQFGYLAPGTYYVRAKPNPAAGQFYVAGYYNNVATGLENATPVVVGGYTVNNINFNLTALGGAISGRVTAQAGGTGLGGIDLDLYDLAGNRMDVNAVTQADGNYVIGPVAPGQYALRVDPSLAQGYPRLYFSAGLNQAEATPINVTSGNTTPNINFGLPQAGSIAGTITATGTSNAIAGIDLDVYDALGQRADFTAVTDAAGKFVLGPLPPGAYKLRADPAVKQGWLVEFFNNRGDLAFGDLINVVAGQQATANMGLDPAGFLEGRIRNISSQLLAGIDLDLYAAANNDRLPVGAASDANGYYLIGPIPVGAYKLRCDPTPVQGVAVEYANSALTIDSATVLNVTQAGLVVDFTLDAGGFFQGRCVHRTTGRPMLGIDMDLFRETSPGVFLRMNQGARTGLEGEWTLGPVPAGRYAIRADGGGLRNIVTTWFGDTTRQDQATLLDFSTGFQVSGLQIRVVVLNAAEAAWTVYE